MAWFEVRRVDTYAVVRCQSSSNLIVQGVEYLSVAILVIFRSGQELADSVRRHDETEGPSSAF